MADDRYIAYRSMYLTSQIKKGLDGIPEEEIPSIIFECIMAALKSDTKSPQTIFNNVIKSYENVRRKG